jgi:hypothetical protein
MAQSHKRLADEQVKMLLHGYRQGLLTRAVVEGMLIQQQLSVSIS